MSTLNINAIQGNQAASEQTIAAGQDRDGWGTYACIGALKGICLGTPTGWMGDSPMGRHLQVGVIEDTVDGSPAAPCLLLSIPGFWRFRWSVKAGARLIQIYALQAQNGTPRPSMVVKANSAVGLASDITAVAPSGTGWVTIGPISFTASATGAVWVELWNNYYGYAYNVVGTATYALFDHIVAT